MKMKTRSELVAYSWELYPDEGTPADRGRNLSRRVAMEQAWLFISGAVDLEKKEKEQISKLIHEKFDAEKSVMLDEASMLISGSCKFGFSDCLFRGTRSCQSCIKGSHYEWDYNLMKE